VTIALVWSRETSVPMKPPWAAARWMPAMISGVSLSGVMVASISGSARNPSSVISLTKLLGVHIDCTPSRSMPGR